jgi:hypothetical protein
MTASTWDTCPRCRSPHTLREDSEVGIAECGMFFVTYHGVCVECGWKFEFRHEEKVGVGANGERERDREVA